MKVLSIDPGYGRCGVAVLEGNGSRSPLLYSACIETKTGEFISRMKEVGRAIESLILEHEPECLAIEEVYFSSNQKTAFRVSEIRGMLLYIGVSRDLPVFEYNPMSVKIALTGYGKATKEQVTSMVQRLVGINEKKRYDDEYDAIAVGLTCLAHESKHFLPK